jgi:catechol 2,3-dioxygenase-like lactoylglutathione lyase family enzyme
MSRITKVGRVMVPVQDQNAAIAFYVETLGFELIADVPFGDGERWVEVAPAAGGVALALVPPRGDYQAGRMTGIAFETTDARAAHEELKAKGVDVDAELMGGDGTVPMLFFFRDHDTNTLMIVESA